MHKIQFGEIPCLDHPENYDKLLIKFISSCLVKDASIRPDIETVLKMNKEFFDHAQCPNFLKKNLLKKLTNIIDRVNIININNNNKL